MASEVAFLGLFMLNGTKPPMAAVPVSVWQVEHKLPLNKVLPLAMLPELPELELELDELLELEELLLELELELELEEELLELEELDELEDELDELELEDELLEELPVPPQAVSSSARESATAPPKLLVGCLRCDIDFSTQNCFARCVTYRGHGYCAYRYYQGCW